MSRILILYGTSEGHTEKIATTMSNALIAAGFDADVLQAGTIDPSIDAYDGVIVTASVHMGKFQKPLVKCVTSHAAQLRGKPNAFLPVSLAVLRKDDPRSAAELVKIVRRFVDVTGWSPAAIKHVAGALPYSQYNFFTRWMMKRIVGMAGGDTDTSRDYVYTDWNDLKAFAVEFGRRLTTAAA